MDLFVALKPIILVLLALAVIFSLISPWKAMSRILAMAILVPIAVGIGGGYLKSFAEDAKTPVDLAILISVVLLIIIALLRFLFGKEIFTHIIGSFIYDVLRESVLMLLRILGRLGRFLTGGVPRGPDPRL